MIYPYPPRARAIGVEIEMVGIAPDQAYRVLLQQKLPSLQRAYLRGNDGIEDGKSRFDYWQVMKDGSLSFTIQSRPGLGIVDENCAEIATPILQPDDSLTNLQGVLATLTAKGATVNDSCALQVHVDLRPEQRQGQFQNAYWQIARAYAAFEPGLDLLIAPLRRNHHMCAPFCQFLPALYRQPNLGVLPRHPKIQPKGKEYGSVEFRALQGTLDFALVAAWIAVTERIVNRALQNPPTVDAIQNLRSLPAAQSLQEFRVWLDFPDLNPAIEGLKIAANTPRLKNTDRGRGRLALRHGGLSRHGRG
jgi:hypothetical protein